MHRSTRLSVLIALVSSSVAVADDADVEATALFEKARELTKAGKEKEACPMFERSQHLVPALGTELNLARCYAAIGRLVDAMKLYRDLQSKLADAHNPQRLQLVRDGIAAVVKKLPKVTIERGVITGEVRIDGEVADVEGPVPLDPGRHTVTAIGAKQIELEIGDGDEKTVTLEALPPPPPPKPGKQDDVLLYTLAGAGGAVFLGTITGIVTIRERDAGRDRCVADMTGALVCDPRGVQLLERAGTMSHVTTGFFVTGIALGTVATLLYVQSRSEKEHATTPVVWASPSSLGFAVEHAW